MRLHPYSLSQETTSPLNRLSHLALLVLATAVLSAYPVPWRNELYYLLRLETFWNPGLFEGDWHLSRPAPEHVVFNAVFGWVTIFVPIEVVGWVGRVLSWTVTLHLTIKLGGHFRLPPWLITASVLMWLLAGQSLVGGEWILLTFEAKSIAYILLFAALDLFLRQRGLLGAALLGLCMSFHPGVGLWAIAAVYSGVVIAGRHSLTELARLGAVTFVCALPGIVPLLVAAPAVAETALDVWEYVARVRMPWHLDPFSWPKRDVLAVLLLFSFNCVHAIGQRSNPPFRFLLGFESALFLAFAIGMAWRATGHYELLRYMPFRLFPVFVMLLFFFHLSKAFVELRPRPDRRVLAVIGVLALTALPNVIGAAFDRVSDIRQAWTTKPDDVMSCLEWIRGSSPPSTIVLTPPTTRNAWWVSRRAQVVNYYYVPYDRLTEWLQRVEAIGGALDTPSGEQDAQEERRMRHYRALSSEQVEDIGKKYGATLLVTDSTYPFPLAFESGRFRVYHLKKNTSQLQAD